MKKFFKPVLVMGVLVLFASCNNDDNKGGDQGPKTTELIVPQSMSVTYIIEDGGDFTEHYNFEYKENSNLISEFTITYDDATTAIATLEYEGDQLIKMSNLEDNELNHLHFNYNSKNQIISLIPTDIEDDSFFYSYNDEGLITKINLEEGYPIHYTLNYNSSKSVIKSEIFLEGLPIDAYTDYTYDTKNTPFKNTNLHFDLSQYELLFALMFSQNNQHNVVKITDSYPVDGKDIYTYDYTYDSKEFPLKVVKKEIGVGIESTITYQYKTITITE